MKRRTIGLCCAALSLAGVALGVLFVFLPQVPDAIGISIAFVGVVGFAWSIVTWVEA